MERSSNYSIVIHVTFISWNITIIKNTNYLYKNVINKKYKLIHYTVCKQDITLPFLLFTLGKIFASVI